MGLRRLVTGANRGTELIPAGLEIAVACGQLLLGYAEPLSSRFEFLRKGVGLLARAVTFLARRCRFLSPTFKFGPEVARLLPQSLELLSKTVTLLTDSFELLSRRIELALTLLALGGGTLAFPIELDLRAVALRRESALQLRPYCGRSGGSLLHLRLQPYRFTGQAALGLGPRGRNFGFEPPIPLGSDVLDLRGPTLFGLGLSGAAGAVELLLVA